MNKKSKSAVQVEIQNPFAFLKEESVALNPFSLLSSTTSTCTAQEEKENFIAADSKLLKVLEAKKVERSTLSMENIEIPRKMNFKDCSIQMAQLPMDWTIKSSINFISETSFNWLFNRNPISESASMLKAIRNQNTSESLIDEYLYYWTYPAWSLTRKQLKGMEIIQKSEKQVLIEDLDEYRFYKNISREWKSALTSIYNLYRNGMIEFFYFLQGDISVVFATRNGAELYCTLNNSTYSLRKKLKEEGIGICFDHQKEDDVNEDELAGDHVKMRIRFY